MSGFVVDASLAMVLCLGEGTGREWGVASIVLQSTDTAVPRLWEVEMRNALVSNERRGRISSGEVNRWFSLLRQLTPAVDESPDYNVALALCRAHRLTFYDALYLELARRRQATLGTLDAALQRAAGAEGVPTIP